MSDLVTFGEAMIRLSSVNRHLEDSESVQLFPGGAEYNVAVNCARLGVNTTFVSRLCDNWVGRYLVNKCRAHGVTVEHMEWVPYDGVGKERNGLFYLAWGAGPRAGAVTYDRAHSAFSNSQTGSVDWKKVFKGAKWFHVSGVTPAVSKSASEVVLEALKAAKKAGVMVSYDLNYRSKLWSTSLAIKRTKQFMPYIHILTGNKADFKNVLGLKIPEDKENLKVFDTDSFVQISKEVIEMYPNIKQIGLTSRNTKSGLLNDWQTHLYDGKKLYSAKFYENLETADRVGSGDAFTAGLISSFLDKRPPQEAVEFAGASSALAHTYYGDTNWATRKHVELLMNGGDARIQR